MYDIVVILIILEFTLLMRNYKDDSMTTKDIDDLYSTISGDDEKRGIDLKTFTKYCSNL